VRGHFRDALLPGEIAPWEWTFLGHRHGRATERIGRKSTEHGHDVVFDTQKDPDSANLAKIIHCYLYNIKNYELCSTISFFFNRSIYSVRRQNDRD